MSAPIGSSSASTGFDAAFIRHLAAGIQIQRGLPRAYRQRLLADELR